MSLQQHRHTFSCKRRTGQPCKKNHKDDGICFKKSFTCRFNYSLPTMVYTSILELLHDEIYEEKEIKAIKIRWEKIKEELKLVSTIFYEILISHPMIALQKL